MSDLGPQGAQPDHKQTRRKDNEAKLHGVTRQIAEATDEAIKASLEKQAEEIRKELDGQD